MADLLEIIRTGAVAGDPTIISILVAIVVIILTILLLLCRGRTSKGQCVLLVGVCDAGKTLLFSRLVHNRYANTHTSVKENSGVHELTGNKKKYIKIADLPGHERLRTKFLEEYKKSARGIIFVVDSLAFMKEIKEVGEYLYTVLTDQEISQLSPALLIACNKQDLTLAKGARIIQANLEKELNMLRKTQSATLEGTGKTDSTAAFLGRCDKDFSFSDLKNLKVDFVECSARGSKDGAEKADLDDLCQWIAKIA